MDLGIVEYGEELTEIFAGEIRKNVADVSIARKRAMDLTDTLAYLKQLSSHEHLILFAEIDREEKADEAHAFYQGLAVLEASTGRNIFKYFYGPGDASESGVRNFAEIVVNYIYHPERLRQMKDGEKMEDSFSPPETEDSFSPPETEL